MQFKTTLLASGFALSTVLVSGISQARLEACGGVYLTSDAHCEFVRDQDCETKCETTSVETACVASLQTECETDCMASAEASCTETCTPSCTETCTTVEKQSSRGMCRCSTKCEGKDNHGRCMSCCQQNLQCSLRRPLS